MRRANTLPKRSRLTIARRRRNGVLLSAAVLAVVVAVAGYVAVRPSHAAVQTVPVYRLANYITHERLFTTSQTEVNNAVAANSGWVNEGIGFYSVPSSYPTAVPVYRLANYITHERLFTTSQVEVNNAIATPGWVSEGVGFYGVPATDPRAVAVYRLANYVTHERLFTTSQVEVKGAVAAYPGWVNEGIGFYAESPDAMSPPPAPTVSSTPPPTLSPSTTPVSKGCANPLYSIPMDPNNAQSGMSFGKYYVSNDTWNVSGYQVAQTLKICDYNNWYATATANNVTGDGAVKTYPNVHEDFTSSPKISSFHTISSSFAESGPHSGLYEYAYDMWLNGVASNGSTEVMIWNDNFGQTPAGSIVASFRDGGQSYNVYKSGSYIAFVDATNVTSGTVNILDFYNFTIGEGWILDSSTIGQIGYGVEIVSTRSEPANFQVKNFSLTTN